MKKYINKHTNIFTRRLLGAAIAAAALITPAVASAQDYPAYANADQQIHGTIAAINGTWNISVADDQGYADSVELHQGTIINPTGLTLEPGMAVTISGYPDGSNFDAMEIDTPYNYQGPAPVAVYYGAGNWYPGYAYGWGPSFSLAFNIGTRSFQQRAFYYGGQIRRAETPPVGWQDRPHGYIGNYGGSHRVSYGAPSQRYPTYAAPRAEQRTFAAPQQQHSYASPREQRTFAAPPQQQRSYAPPQEQRTFAAPPQQQRSFAAPPQQQRSFAAPPQQQRTYAAPPQQQRTFAAPPQQQRTYAAPPQQQPRSFAPPAQQPRNFAPQQQPARPAPQERNTQPVSRAAAPAQRVNQDPERSRRGG